ncbi:hypothetical protein [Pseudodesulfovibrio profundus]|uniref:hypothetical protein n=1 Tax=Pseudodesulfovibrio profundus TaxID=57320 RepID=UPI001390370F|nr:hypothetical protein [Pseudodesulfovibrio profundus]
MSGKFEINPTHLPTLQFKHSERLNCKVGTTGILYLGDKKQKKLRKGGFLEKINTKKESEAPTPRKQSHACLSAYGLQTGTTVEEQIDSSTSLFNLSQQKTPHKKAGL